MTCHMLQRVLTSWMHPTPRLEPSRVEHSVHACNGNSTHTYMHTYIHTYIHTHAFSHIHMQHTHTHAHVHGISLSVLHAAVCLMRLCVYHMLVLSRWDMSTPNTRKWAPRYVHAHASHMCMYVCVWMDGWMVDGCVYVCVCMLCMYVACMSVYVCVCMRLCISVCGVMLVGDDVHETCDDAYV